MQHIVFSLFLSYFSKVKAKNQRAAPTQEQKARQQKQPHAK
jgi:hypothetical protein